MEKYDDKEINKFLELIGAYTVTAIVLFMIACTVLQIGSWIESAKSICEVTVQKE